MIQEIKEGAVPPGDGFVSGSVGFQESTDLSPWTHTVVKPDEGGNTLVGTFNTRPEDIVVQKGQKYGTFRRMCTIQEVNKTPWRICAIGAPGEVATSDSPGEEKSAKFKQGRRGASSKERRLWLQEEFKLRESECLLTVRDVEEATDLLMYFWDVSSHDGSYGKTNLITRRRKERQVQTREKREELEGTEELATGRVQVEGERVSPYPQGRGGGHGPADGLLGRLPPRRQLREVRCPGYSGCASRQAHLPCEQGDYPPTRVREVAGFAWNHPEQAKPSKLVRSRAEQQRDSSEAAARESPKHREAKSER